eukprot:scaffold9134_cov170-Amphora_coffeaeformis.AAC.4
MEDVLNGDVSFEEDYDDDEENLLTRFDQICFRDGDADAIQLRSSTTGGEEEAICYLELQELSIILASQLHYRSRPSVVLLDCYGHVVAETVAILACLRLRIPFVPVSVYDQHAAAGRLEAVVGLLQQHYQQEDCVLATGNIVAISGADNDKDPGLGVFYKARIHKILYLDRLGNLREQIQVPRFQSTREDDGNMIMSTNKTVNTEKKKKKDSDDLYILFTSGTSSGNPKAVKGSHRSTFRRLKWFRDTFAASPRVARRTQLTFVDSITELLGTLLHPPSILVAVDPDVLRDQGLVALLSSTTSFSPPPTQITMLPSQLSILLNHLPNETLACLERIIISGEPCPGSLVCRFSEKLDPACQVINLYGQTESTGDVMVAVLTDLGPKAVCEGVVAVGSPILPTIFVSTTEKGELVLQGNLANGYLGETRPFEKYATGDVGFLKDGIWYIQGRCDDVVKVNGVLTSPSEIEAAFSKFYSGVTRPIAATILDGRVYVVCEQEVAEYSREDMHQAGIPWNLIPFRLIHHAIPVSDTGAGKVNRSALRELVKRILSAQRTTLSETKSKPTVESTFKEVLFLEKMDPCKSFVALGGDSALAIQSLYCLRQAKLLAQYKLSAQDILQAESIQEIESLIKGEQDVKRRRIDYPILPPIKAPFSQVVSNTHVAVPFIACVDASPAVGIDSFYIACQGGQICKVGVTGEVLAYQHFPTWKFEADCLMFDQESEKIVIAAGFNDLGKGTVIAMDSDLKQIKWQKEMDGGIRRVPFFLCRSRSSELWFRSGCNLVVLNAVDGNVVHTTPMSSNAFSRPIVDDVNQAIWYLGDVLVRIKYDRESPEVEGLDKYADSVGPCYKDGFISGQNLIMCDSWGQIHLIDTLSLEIKHTIQVTSCPLSSPVKLGEDSFLVGSYDGRLLAFTIEGSSETKKLWETQLDACVYARPVLLPNETLCLVCTTAGDAVMIQTSGGAIVGKSLLNGEIWSDPKVIWYDDSSSREKVTKVALGARDSHVHILTLNLESPQ